MQISEEQIKQRIKNLVEDFNNNSVKYKKELEANTETKLVEPLFEILGWTKNDFVKRENAHRGVKRGLTMRYQKCSFWGALGKKIGNITVWARFGFTYSKGKR